MTYPVNRKNGDLLVNVPERNIVTTYPVNFIGRRTNGFGEVQNENFLHLLENFADNSEPNNPVIGQLWYYTTASKLYVCVQESPVAWAPIQRIWESQPPDPDLGELWWDDGETVLKVWNGSSWVTIGPLDDSLYTQGIEQFSGASSVWTYTLANNESALVEAKIVAKDTSSGMESVTWIITANPVRQGSSAASIIDDPNIETVSRSGGAGAWTAVPDVNGNNFRIIVTATANTVLTVYFEAVKA